MLNTVEGKMGLNGSSMPESTNSSMIVLINHGKKIFNNYCEAPLVLIKDLFLRQCLLISTMNKKLYEEWLALEAENRLSMTAQIFH